MVKKIKTVLEEMKERVAAEEGEDTAEELFPSEDNDMFTADEVKDLYTSGNDFLFDTNNTDILSTTGSFGTTINAGNTWTTSVFEDPMEKIKEKVDNLDANVTLIVERLKIIEADFEKHEKYPALKDLYDQYKMIESMIDGDTTDESK